MAAFGGMRVTRSGAAFGTAPASVWRERGWIAAIGLATFVAALSWLWPLAMIFDSDSYYHLAVAREYAQHGLIRELPWARFSAMRHGFGDKEFLFHGLLIPFAGARAALFGAKLAIAGLSAAIAATLAALGRAALGRSGLWLPALLLCGSLSFDLRLIRLRPELLALLLLLWTVEALSRRRYLLVAAGSGVFALAYTAIHALLGLIVCGFIGMLWLDRSRQPPSAAGRPNWRAHLARCERAWIVLPVLTALIALALHPHFPHNLQIFYLQNILFWKFHDSADIGTEIRPLGMRDFLTQNWALFAGCAVLAASLRRGTAPEPSATGTPVENAVASLPGDFGLPPSAAPAPAGSRAASGVGVAPVPAAEARSAWLAAWCYGWAALVFCALFARSARFAIYALPFALLALAWLARARGLFAAQRLRALGAPRSWLVLCLVCCASLPLTAAKLTELADKGGSLWPAQRRQLEAFGRALPAGAKVAAPWVSAEDYMFFAPQGRYLNVLDPIFMRALDEAAYFTQRRLFEGKLSDIPLALQALLDSDYLAFDARALPRLHAQVQRDPRLVPILGGGHALYRFEATGSRAFVLDWRVAARRAELPSAPEAEPSANRPYPRAQEPRARASEGIVDSARVGGAGRCLWFAPAQPLERGSFEFGADAAARIFQAGQRLTQLPARRAVTLGSGQPLELTGEALQIELCSGESAGRFYLLRR